MEWVWTDTYIIDDEEDYETCLCGHYPIKECCVIRNTENGNEEIVGNCCINKFMDTESHLIFQCIKRVFSDPSKSLNVATIEYVFRRHLISSWEYKFYTDIHRKRILSEKQEMIKLRINKRVIRRFRHKRTKRHKQKELIYTRG